jgi:hypothetical protein
MMSSEILSVLPRLNDYRLPPQYAQDDSGPPTAIEAKLREYEIARDDFLQCKVMHAVVEHAMANFDETRGKFDTRAVPAVDDEEKKALDERCASVLQSLSDKADDIKCRVLELRAKHARFQERRAELMNLVIQQQDQLSDVDEDAHDEDVTVHELDTDEKFSAIERKHSALKVSLQSLEQQTKAAEKQLEERNACWKALTEKENESFDIQNLDSDPEALERLRRSNAEIKAKLSDLTETTQYYNDMRLLLEKLSGIRVLSVNQASGLDDGLSLTVELMQKYLVEVTLAMATPARNRDFTVAAAKFVSDSTLITGPTVHTHDGDDTVEGSVVQLRIPPLDDVVKLVESLPSGENIRVFLTETLARIRIVEERVADLTLLLNERRVVTQISPWIDGGPSEGISSLREQQVICSWNSLQLTVVLRLSPDFPLTNGSVSIDQLIGFAGWDSAVIERIKTSVNECSSIRSTVGLLHAIQSEVQRLQDEEGIKVPTTPTLPMRRQM